MTTEASTVPESGEAAPKERPAFLKALHAAEAEIVLAISTDLKEYPHIWKFSRRERLTEALLLVQRAAITLRSEP